MIYLIDDKKTRQERNFGWTEEKFAKYKDIIKPLYNIEDIEIIGEKLYDKNNIILYHESFLDKTDSKERAIDQRNKIKDLALKGESIITIFFSGSINSRSIEGDFSTMPVDKIYNNLENYIKKYNSGLHDAKYLVYGQNPELENELITKREIAIKAIEISTSTIQIDNNLVLETTDKKILLPKLENSTIKPLFKVETDEDISSFISKNLNELKYENIFIPLFCGKTLSDYNGLRIATHIRCSDSLNQLSRIIIYGFVDLYYLLENDYFNILRTNSVEYLPLNRDAIEKLNSIEVNPITKEELRNDILKLNIPIPENYTGNHSIANEWAIYRWAKLTSNSFENLGGLFSKVENSLYFKYLRTIHLLNIDKGNIIEPIDAKDKQILLIDDQAKDGWEEVLKSFFKDSIFKVATNYEDGLNLAKDLKWDLILLDLRLDPANEDIDGELINPEDFSGAKLLREIKEFNPGLQLIMLTASNKSWNLKKLLELGVNGYYVKESPEFNYTIEHTIENIKNFKRDVEKCFEMGFLKDIFLKLENLESSKFIDCQDNSFKDIVFNYLSTSKDLLLSSSKNKEFINKAYLQIFFIIEEFIKLDNIFKENDFKELGKEWYVIIDDVEILVRKSKKIDNGYKIESAIQMNSKYELKKHNYILKKDPRLDVNYKVSSLLIFRFGNPNSSVKKWTNIYTKRNADGVAHSKPDEVVSSFDFILLLDFIDYLFNTPIDLINKEKGLTQTSLKERTKELLDKFKK